MSSVLSSSVRQIPLMTSRMSSSLTPALAALCTAAIISLANVSSGVSSMGFLLLAAAASINGAVLEAVVAQVLLHDPESAVKRAVSGLVRRDHRANAAGRPTVDNEVDTVLDSAVARSARVLRLHTV